MNISSCVLGTCVLRVVHAHVGMRELVHMCNIVADAEHCIREKT